MRKKKVCKSGKKCPHKVVMLLTEVTYAILGTGSAVVYSVASVILYYKYDEFYEFRAEIAGMLVNGLIGTVGLVVYGLNIPIAGQVATWAQLLARSCSQPNCDALTWRLIAFSICSTLRFVCWYAEFLVSFSFLVAFRHLPWCAIPLRYAIHTLNVMLSATTFGLSLFYTFPSSMVVGSDRFPPVVVQSLLLTMAFMSFWFIARSPLFRVRWVTEKSLSQNKT